MSCSFFMRFVSTKNSVQLAWLAGVDESTAATPAVAEEASRPDDSESVPSTSGCEAQRVDKPPSDAAPTEAQRDSRTVPTSSGVDKNAAAAPAVMEEASRSDGSESVPSTSGCEAQSTDKPPSDAAPVEAQKHSWSVPTSSGERHMDGDRRGDRPSPGVKDLEDLKVNIWKECTGGSGARCWLWDNLNQVNELMRHDFLHLKINDSATGLFLIGHGMQLFGLDMANVGGLAADCLLQKHSCIHKLFSTIDALQTWHLRGIRDLTVWDIRALLLIKALKTGKCLQHVKFTMVTGHEGCMDKLAKAFRTHPSLKHVEFGFSEFTPEYFRVLLEGVAGMPQLEHVTLHWSSAVERNHELLKDFLRNCSRLKKLEIIKFEFEELKAVLEVLDQCTPLKELVLDYPHRRTPGKVLSFEEQIAPRGPDKMCTVPLMKMPANLTTLDVSIDFGDECIAGIAEHLISSNFLENISIVAIKVGDEAALALATAVERSKCLRKLMFCAKVSREAFLAFANAVEANTDVKLSFGSSASVHLRDWLVRDHHPSVFSRFLFAWKPDVHDVLTAVLRSGQYLPVVNLATDEYVSRTALGRLFRALVENGRVEQVSLECQPSHDLTSYVDMFVYLLRQRSSISRLYIAKPVLSEQDCMDVLDALGCNKSLTEFECGSLQATDRVIQALIDAVRQNDTLVEMKFTFGEPIETMLWSKLRPQLRDNTNLLRLKLECPSSFLPGLPPHFIDLSSAANMMYVSLAAHYVMGHTSSPEGAEAFQKLAWSTALRHVLSAWPSGSETLTKKLIALSLENAASRWGGH